MKFTRFETLSIKDHPELGETWVQARIAEDPKSLGLGDIVLKDKERRQPRAGRLDLLLQDSVESRRYEVEVQLGQVDESHIIRTIEYWDIERRRYPQYEHTAVIIAEDITSRFLNIISLFNGMIPLVAIQMKALKSGDEVGLVFTTVVDQLPLGLVGEDEEIQESADRTYWEQRSSKKALAIVDELLNFTRIHDKELELKYNKFYIGLAIAGQANNFVIFRPRSGFLRLEPRLKNTPETQASLESAGLDVMDYDSRWGRYRIRLQPGDVTKYKEAIAKVIAKAYEESSRD
jgi:hypothetical protein